MTKTSSWFHSFYFIIHVIKILEFNKTFQKQLRTKISAFLLSFFFLENLDCSSAVAYLMYFSTEKKTKTPECNTTMCNLFGMKNMEYYKSVSKCVTRLFRHRTSCVCIPLMHRTNDKQFGYLNQHTVEMFLQLYT